MALADEINEILADAQSPLLKPQERQKLLSYARKRVEEHERHLRQTNFLEFFRFMRPQFLMNWHHAELAAVIERAESTPNAREMVNLPPRTTKSEEISVCGTAWVIGKHPEWKVLQLCLNQKLVEEFGRKTRDTIDSDEYRQVFPDIQLHASSRAVNSFATRVPGSKYLAAGAGSNIHGFGADWCVIDDPLGDRDCTPNGMAAIYEWYQHGPRLRLQPRGRIVAAMSRWPGNDFCRQLLTDAKTGRGEAWNLLKIPAYTLSEETGEQIWMWPEFWEPEFMEMRQLTTPPAIWKSQFMQEDVSDQNASVIPEDRWRIWPYVNDQLVLPAFSFILQSWDTAFTEKTRNSASACTTWGIFYLRDQSKNMATLYGQEQGLRDYNPGPEVPQAMLLDCYKGYVEFPMLKRVALNQFRIHRPDEIWIEGRASGKPLMQDLRKMGLPLKDYSPVSGETKDVRFAAVSDFWASGMIWTLDYHRQAHQHLYEVISQCARGPGNNDADLVDSVSMALRRFRKGGFIKSSLDDSELEPMRSHKRWRSEPIYG